MKNTENISPAKEQLLELAEKKKVKISGLGSVPLTVLQVKPAASLHNIDQSILDAYGLDQDDLFEAEGFMNTAIFPGGRVVPLRIVSNQYKLVQHDEMILEVFQSIPDNMGVHEIQIDTTWSGSRCFVKFKTDKSTEIIPGDIIEFRISAANSVDGSMMFNLHQGAYRQWCSNGAMTPDSRFKKIKSKRLHKTGLELGAEIGRFVASLDQAQAAMEGWKKYTKVKLGAPDLDSVFKQLNVGPRVKDELMETELKGDETTPKALLENKNLTAWNMYNAFTQRITHGKSDEGVKIEKGLAVSSVFEHIVNEKEVGI